VLGVISSETRRMRELIDDLLAFSRLGRQTMEASSIDMSALCRAAYAEHSAPVRDRTLQLKLQPLPAVRGDRGMIRVGLGILISNAIKFTAPRPLSVIEIGGRRENGQAVFWVKDNGVGFDMRYASKLFGVFQRLHSREEFDGTGVGLALAQRIVHRHGGRIWADATVNQGATFFFSLPDGPEGLG
jgi:two-component system sensor kinase